ncbi:MAG: phosphate/phosphite/phosphonate ABC transporter substrate-binding protein [Thermodesulfobacteriota bacterium]
MLATLRTYTCPKLDSLLIVVLLQALFICLQTQVQAAEKSLSLIIPPVEEVDVMYRQFLPVREHLQKELDLEVKLKVEGNYSAALEKIGQGKADLAYLDPAAYCEARHKYGILPLVKKVHKEADKDCGSVLAVREGSQVQKIVQAQGKSLALGSVHSSSSYLMPLAMFREVDIKLEDFSQVGYLQKEDQVALSLLVGDYEIGAMSQEVASKYSEYGLRKIHCSERIPGSVLSASNGLDPELRRKVEKALLDYQDQGQGKNFAQVQDQEYDVVRIMLKNITGQDYLHYPEDTLKLGLLPLYSAISLHEMFQPLAEYLGQATDREFRLVIPKDFEEFVQLVREGEVDFTFQNPYVHLLLAKDGYLEPLALTISPEPKEPREEFRGVILTRKDSEIQDLQDLLGKRIMIVSHKSAGGYWFQNILLRQELGVDISQKAELVEGKRHEEVILSLYRGDVQAGFVREAALFQAQELVDMERIQVLARTPYHPNWPLSAASHVPQELTRQVQRALLELQDEDMLSKARIRSFTDTNTEGLRRLQELVEFE